MTKSIISKPSLERGVLSSFNERYQTLSIEERLTALFHQFDEKEILITSSFGTKSVLLLHMLQRIKPGHPVYFINTGYNFQDTLKYKEQLIEQFDLNVIEIKADKEQHEYTRITELWKSDNQKCCDINKVQPLAPVKSKHKIWISGLMAYQTPHRAGLNIFEQKGEIVKFHPFIDISEDEFESYLDRFNLPRHPLEAQGYGSVGCTHCTSKGKGREGRWKGSEKTECGLHPDYFAKKLAQK
ncbi:MAG: phosphoadenylyl-sulfate reductase [Bacteroidota bacterium]